ncbi:MAG: hypothetical protein RIQ94_111 [Pseudomonadota bacterium]
MLIRAFLFSCSIAIPALAVADWNFYTEDYSKHKIIGQSLPANWRPFADNSPWNTPLSDGVSIHPDSAKIMATVHDEAKNIRLVKRYNTPIWVVNSDNMPQQKVNSRKIFDFWDKDRDDWSDVPVPIEPSMWAEATNDGHITIIDPFKMIAWEMSRFSWQENDDGSFTPKSTTFNIWDLKGTGYAIPEGKRWHTRGGRGSGFPVIAGIIRPEELQANIINHALIFSFSKNRRSEQDKDIFINPPAARSDGKYVGAEYPIEGMRFQLDPTLTEADFDKWGLTKEAKVVARTLQRYGMFLGDSGGSMAIEVQMLAPFEKGNLIAWEERFPGFYASVAKIPTQCFRVIDTEKKVIIK